MLSADRELKCQSHLSAVNTVADISTLQMCVSAPAPSVQSGTYTEHFETIKLFIFTLEFQVLNE